MYDSYKKHCENGNFKIGMLQVWKQSRYDFVLNFPTKKNYKDKVN